MEEILHHLGCINSVNNGKSYLSTGAGFLPSTVWEVFMRRHVCVYSLIVDTGYMCG